MSIVLDLGLPLVGGTLSGIYDEDEIERTFSFVLLRRWGGGMLWALSRLFCDPLQHGIALILIEEPGYRWQKIYGRYWYSKCVLLCHSRVASRPTHFLQEQTNLAEMYQGTLQQCKAVLTRV